MVNNILQLVVALTFSSQIDISEIDTSENIINDTVAKVAVIVENTTRIPETQARFHPVKIDTSGTGAIRITVYPKETNVYVNEKMVGSGNQFIEPVQSGLYNILLEYNDEQKKDIMLVRSGEVSSNDYTLGRKLYFILEPTFSNLWIKGTRCFGPALDMGLSYKNNYYGINYIWDFGSRNNGNLMTFGGAAIQFSHEFNYQNIMSLSPGACLGFWMSDGYKGGGYEYYNSDYYGNYYSPGESLNESFFGGFTLKAKFGYKRVFAVLTYTFLYGTYVANGLQYGIQFKL